MRAAHVSLMLKGGFFILRELNFSIASPARRFSAARHFILTA
jgi:hypothetical protein